MLGTTSSTCSTLWETLKWRQSEQQSGQETVTNVAGEDGGGFRAVVTDLICRVEGGSQGTCRSRWWSPNRIGRSEECRKVTGSIWQVLRSCPMGSQKKNYNSEERTGLVTDESLTRSRWLWSSRWGSDCLGRTMGRWSAPVGTWWVQGEGPWEKSLGTALREGGMLGKVCLPSFTQRKGKLFHGSPVNQIDKL